MLLDDWENEIDVADQNSTLAEKSPANDLGVPPKACDEEEGGGGAEGGGRGISEMRFGDSVVEVKRESRGSE